MRVVFWSDAFIFSDQETKVDVFGDYYTIAWDKYGCYVEDCCTTLAGPIEPPSQDVPSAEEMPF